MRITLPAHELATALTVTMPFAGTDKTLPALNVVHVMIGGDGDGPTVIFASTDRFTLGEYTASGDDVSATDSHVDGFSVPLDTVKQWHKIAKAAASSNYGVAREPATITLENDSVTLTVSGNSLTGNVETSPWVRNYERLFPQEPGTAQVGSVAFQSHVLNQFFKAFGRKVFLEFAFGNNNLKPIMVTAGNMPEFRGLIMPARKA